MEYQETKPANNEDKNIENKVVLNESKTFNGESGNSEHQSNIEKDTKNEANSLSDSQTKDARCMSYELHMIETVASVSAKHTVKISETNSLHSDNSNTKQDTNRALDNGNFAFMCSDKRCSDTDDNTINDKETCNITSTSLLDQPTESNVNANKSKQVETVNSSLVAHKVLSTGVPISGDIMAANESNTKQTTASLNSNLTLSSQNVNNDKISTSSQNLEIPSNGPECLPSTESHSSKIIDEQTLVSKQQTSQNDFAESETSLKSPTAASFEDHCKSAVLTKVSDAHNTSEKSSSISSHHIQTSSGQSLQSPPQAHEKNNPHLIPISSLSTNSMMTSTMSMFPPMMNPYFQGMMFDPRMAAAFQHSIFRGMPPHHHRYQQVPQQRAPRSRGSRGPRHSKSQQQHIPPEVMRHHGRILSSDSTQIKNDLPTENIATAVNTVTASSIVVSHTTPSAPKIQSDENKSDQVSLHQQPPPAHSHGNKDVTPHLVTGTLESLPPPAHSSHVNIQPSVARLPSDTNCTTTSVTSLTVSHQGDLVATNIQDFPEKQESKSMEHLVSSSLVSATCTTQSVNEGSVSSEQDNTKSSIMSSVDTSGPMPAHAQQYTLAEATSGSVPLPAHVHTTISSTQIAPVTTLTSSAHLTADSLHQAVSTESLSKSFTTIAEQQSSQSTMPGVSLPMPAHEHQVSMPSSNTQVPMPAHFHPPSMHPGMVGPPFMQQNMRIRGPRMSTGKQRGADMAPGLPSGMMPQFPRFPPGFPFMSPHIARMAMSPEMMALAQKMSAGTSTATTTEGEHSGSQVPKFDNQMETIMRAVRMRPLHFPVRPGMQHPPRNMPPPPRYPGPPLPSPTLTDHRHPSAVGQISPTSSVKQMSPSQSPHPSASPLASTASPMSSVTGAGDKTPSPVPRSPANSDTTSLGSTPIKQEPAEKGMNTCISFNDDIDSRTATQNAILKQLLANMGGTRSSGTPFSEDSEDGSSLQLTPEQQKQLDMIESMPVIREVELTPEDWQSKTPEEREKLIELRKQAFEEKRKEFEDRKKRKPPLEPRKRKKKTDQTFPDIYGESQMVLPQLQPPPKKRQRRPKQKKTDIEEDRVENFLAQLRMLVPVPLQEPRVTSAIVNSPVHGSASVLTGESQLKGDFGTAYLEGVADFYGNTLLGGLPPLGSLVGDIESKHKIQTEDTDIADRQRKMGTEPVHQPPFSISSLPGMAATTVSLTLPSQPRIEPRVQALRISDSPDTVISSSSPEHEFGEEEVEFPMLKPIDPAEENCRSSPLLPLLQPVAIKAESLQSEEDNKTKCDQLVPDISDKKISSFDPGIEALANKNLNGKTSPFTSSLTHPLKDKDISVTLTLSAKAAEDIGGVLSSIAELLKIAVPPTYQLSRSPSPESLKLGLKHKEDPINIHSLIKMKPKFCRNCDMVVMDKGYVKKKSEMPFIIKEDHFTFREAEDEDIAFCSQKCFERFVVVYKSIFKSGGFGYKMGQQKDDATFFPEKSMSLTSLSPFPSTPPTVISPRGSGLLTPNSSGERTPQLTPTTPTGTPALSSGVEPTTPTRQRLDSEKLSRKHKKPDVPPKPPPKRWKNIRYKKWDPSFSQELQPRPETPKSEVEVLWKALGTIITPDPMPEDKRVCVFCQGVGDGATDGPGRLLNMDVDKWAHLNCALWSSEVYETLNGDLMNVDVAHKRSQALECQACKKLGATIGCFKVNCSKVYHLGCAQKSGCMFFQDKTILCPPHAPKTLPDNVLTNLSVYRKVYVNRDEDKQVASMIRGQEEGTYALRISSLILHSVGQLLPHQILTGKFHTRDFIYPVGFKSSRFYWSMRRLYKRCRYVCSISDNDGKPEFTIRVVEAGFEDIVMKDNSPRCVWFKVLEPLDKMRRNADLVKIFPSFMTGEELFGLTEPAIIRVIESLPGTDLLKNYAFKFGRCELIEMPLTINPTGCARTEPKLRTHFRKTHTLQSSHTSRSLPAMVTGVTGDINSPYMKQFVHSKSQQYRKLKTEWRTNVYLGRSRIQGLGLFAARDLEKHTMVIEYIGYLIRNEVANRMEITYDEQNRGVYMFRIDSDVVVDATMAGGPARYINHSCDPNCVAEVVPFDKESKIIIITNRRIPKGEELTYDYKFDFEDEQHKIPCCCGAKRCRKWMN